MPNLEKKIFASLSGASAVTTICASRIYPLILPQNPTYPAITYQRVAGRRENDITNGYVGMENAIVQMDAWATSFETAASLSSAIIVTVCAANSFKALAMNSPLDIYEDDIQAYRRSVDISIWNKE